MEIAWIGNTRKTCFFLLFFFQGDISLRTGFVVSDAVPPASNNKNKRALVCIESVDAMR